MEVGARVPQTTSHCQHFKLPYPEIVKAMKYLWKTHGIKFTTLNDSTEEFFVVRFETSQKEGDGLLTYWQSSNLYVLALAVKNHGSYVMGPKKLITNAKKIGEPSYDGNFGATMLMVGVERSRYDKYLSNTSYDLIQDWKKFSKDAFKYDPEDGVLDDEDVKLIHGFLEPGHLTENEEKKILKQLEGKPRVCKRMLPVAWDYLASERYWVYKIRHALILLTIVALYSNTVASTN
ncbi:hypothetical protein Tco_1098957 [Tanacetum coccineum]